MATQTYDVTDPNRPKISKDPNATLDYTWNWANWLTPLTDTIASHEIIVPSGLTLLSSADNGTRVIAWISGGILGTSYEVTCRITTVGNRVEDRTILLSMKER